MNKYAIIAAGGSGRRITSPVPKQFLPLNGKPVLFHTLNAFFSYDVNTELLLVLPEDQTDYWKDLCNKQGFGLKHKVVVGGATRFQSVKNGLDEIIDDATDSLVAIHDGARPLVSANLIKRVFDTAEKYDAVVPAMPVNESLRMVEADQNMAVNRKNYCIVQTPQCFRSTILKKAYRQPYIEDFNDDASVVEACGVNIHMVDGESQNIKITTENDLIIAESLMKKGNNG